VRGKNTEAGFVVSTEIQLVALVLVLGLVAGWVKLRDQSLAEVKDTMAAVDTYITGSAEVWKTGGTRWIAAGVVIEPSMPVIEELWGNTPGSEFSASSVEPIPGFPGVYRSKDGFLTYGPVVPE